MSAAAEPAPGIGIDLLEIERLERALGRAESGTGSTVLLAGEAGIGKTRLVSELAAHAGDAGKGFAVVAAEVRGLAQRSSAAAKDIGALISASSRQVKSGVDSVGQTGEALQRIVALIGSVDQLVSQIATSTQEQAAGVQEINTAANEMNKVTQQNAVAVEESSAATRVGAAPIWV